MATLAISTLIKAGLATVTAGVAIATPFVLKRNNDDSPSTSRDSDSGSSEHSRDTENTLKPDSSRTIDTQSLGNLNGSPHDSLGAKSDTEERGNSMSILGPAKPDNSLESVKQSVISSPTSALKDKFKKKCFIVPAKSNNSDNAQLLTCFNAESTSRSDTEGEYPEYDSIYHLYDSKRNEIPLKVEGGIEWNPHNKQISVRLEKRADSVAKYTFTAEEGDKWNGVSKNPLDILSQCAIYEITSKDSLKNVTYLLTCGADSTSFTSADPKGIPLTPWTLNQ